MLSYKKVEKNVLTAELIEKKVRELVAASPDNCYRQRTSEGCEYLAGVCDNDSIGCLFGQALREIGLTEEQYKVLEEADETGEYNRIGDLLISMGTSLTPGYKLFFNEIQSQQDKELSWSKCLREII